MWKSKFYGAFVLNRRVDLHAIDATPARWRGDAGSYGYLLPKFIWFWARHPALWVGMIVLLTLKAFLIRKRFVATHKNIKI